MITFIRDGSTYFVGTAREVCSLYKNMWKKTSYIPIFSEAPKFNMTRLYGIQLIEDDPVFPINNGTFSVIGHNEVCNLIMEEV